MKIGVSANGGSLDAEVEPRFGQCPYFVVVDSDTMRFDIFHNSGSTAPGGAGVKAAQTFQQRGVNVVLTGQVGPNAQQGLEAAGIKIVTGVSGKVRKAVDDYLNPAVSKLWMPPHIMARCAEHPNIVADKENTPDVTQYKAMRDAVDPAKMTVLCGLGDLQFAYEAALGCSGFVSWTANLAPELSLALLEAADACDFQKVREIAGKTGRLYEFAGVCAQHRGRDPWVISGFTAGHIYVGIMKAAMDMLGLAGGPVRGPSDELTDDERKALREILRDIGIL